LGSETGFLLPDEPERRRAILAMNEGEDCTCCCSGEEVSGLTFDSGVEGCAGSVDLGGVGGGWDAADARSENNPLFGLAGGLGLVGVEGVDIVLEIVGECSWIAGEGVSEVVADLDLPLVFDRELEAAAPKSLVYITEVGMRGSLGIPFVRPFVVVSESIR